MKKVESIKFVFEVNMNLGLIVFVKGDKVVVEFYLGKVVGVKELNEILGNLYVV